MILPMQWILFCIGIAVPAIGWDHLVAVGSVNAWQQTLLAIPQMPPNNPISCSVVNAIRPTDGDTVFAISKAVSRQLACSESIGINASAEYTCTFIGYTPKPDVLNVRHIQTVISVNASAKQRVWHVACPYSWWIHPHFNAAWRSSRRRRAMITRHRCLRGLMMRAVWNYSLMHLSGWQPDAWYILFSNIRHYCQAGADSDQTCFQGLPSKRAWVRHPFRFRKSSLRNDPPLKFVGGGRPKIQRHVKASVLVPYATSLVELDYLSDDFQYQEYRLDRTLEHEIKSSTEYITVRMPLSVLKNYVNVSELHTLARVHALPYTTRMSRENLLGLFTADHFCPTCENHVAVFKRVQDAGPTPKQVRPSDEVRHKQAALTYETAISYALNSNMLDDRPPTGYEFVGYIPVDSHAEADDLLVIDMPVLLLLSFLSKKDIECVARCHGIFCNQNTRVSEIIQDIKNHSCDHCPNYVSVWKMKWDINPSAADFPPPVVDSKKVRDIIHACADDLKPENINESGCAVCGLLYKNKDQILFDANDYPIHLLKSHFSRKERRCAEDPIEPLDGPLIDDTCSRICRSCHESLSNERVPTNALANGFWLGKVPTELTGLTMAEQMLVARVRHNRCVVRVASGRVKMMANVIMFTNPTPVLYNVLPPPRKDFDEVLAFIYTGSSLPTEEDKVRTPLLVRRNKIRSALEWLKLNHIDYSDLEISSENLKEYPEEGVPFTMEFHKTTGEGNKDPLTMSVHELDIEEGNEHGPCPYTIHGLTGVEYSTMSTQAMKAIALRHLQSGGKVLGVGHDGVPVSLYDDQQAYPKMFPWLFPYGYGGIGQAHLKKKVSAKAHKRNLLLYHDKRFQRDVHFPIVAFNHEQIKSSVTGSFLTAKRSDFPNIVERLANLDPNTLVTVASRLLAGEHVRPETDAEKACYSLLNDIDHVGGHVDGSLSGKKQRRNELWSMLAFKGAPMWFITFSPADVKHPLCLYYAGERLDFDPDVVLSSEERNLLISQNPVAAARFFDFMVKAFIQHVLGIGSDNVGLFGETDAYYGMVEQQGRLTLHLHLLLWIAGSPSPQNIRDRLVANDSNFRKALVDYLESVHTGQPVRLPEAIKLGCYPK